MNRLWHSISRRNCRRCSGAAERMTGIGDPRLFLGGRRALSGPRIGLLRWPFEVPGGLTDGRREDPVRALLPRLPAELGAVPRQLALVAAVVLVLAGCMDSTPSSSSALKVGDRAPTFELPAAGGGRASLKDYVGEGPVLLYFSMGPG
jgi:hypothetical protein